MPHNNIQTTVQGYPVRTSGASYLPRSIQALQAMGNWQYQQIGGDDLWLRMEIAIAFKQFLCMRLGNTPAVEMLPFTAESWVTIVGTGMIEAVDRERIKLGFNQLYRTLKWWPQPAELLNILPRRKTNPSPASPYQGRSFKNPPDKGGWGVAAEDADIDTSAGSAALQDILDMMEQKEREVRHAE